VFTEASVVRGKRVAVPCSSVHSVTATGRITLAEVGFPPMVTEPIDEHFQNS